MATRRAARRLPRVGGGRVPARLLVVLVVALTVAGTTWFSGASFTSSTTSRATVGAAGDYYPPTVTVAAPPATSTGTLTVSATAADTGSGVVRVVFQYAASPSGAWTDLCTDTTAPWSCTWDTTKVADGDYRLRAVAYDAAGFSTTSALGTTRVANAAAVTLGAVADPARGTVPLSATVTGASGRTVSSSFQYRLVDSTGAWTTISGCGSVAGTSPTCSWATGTLADDYDIRVVSTLGATTVTDTRLGVTVDNLAPTATLTLPATLTGTVVVAPSVLDDDSGLATVALDYKLASSGTWTSLCTLQTEPWRCSLDTTKLQNFALYDVRAVVRDVAGNETVATVTNRRVDNTLASVSLTAPSGGDVLRGTSTLTAAADPGAVGTTASVAFQRRAVGSTTWVTVCTDTAAPWSCDWDTTAVTSGQYELRAVQTYNLTLTVASAVVTVTVDNNPLRGLDVQVANGGLAGRADAGDAMTLTYSTVVNLASIKAGWAGEATPITVTIRDKKVAGATIAGYDRAEFSVGLGQVAFVQNYAKKSKSVAVPATMTATTATVGGVPVTVVTVVLGTPSATGLASSTAGGTMQWSPSSAATTPGGVASSTARVGESGGLDAEW